MKIRTEFAPDGLRYCFTALDSPFLVQLLGHLHIERQKRETLTIEVNPAAIKRLARKIGPGETLDLLEGV